MAVEMFENYLLENDLDDINVEITDSPTQTAVDAAKVHKVPVCNIVKSLLVRVRGNNVIFLVPGDKRLDFSIVAEKLGVDENSVRMATPDEVKEITGYSIGGVPPFGHLNRLETIVWDGFDGDSELVAAAGARNAVFRIGLERLRKVVKN